METKFWALKKNPEEMIAEAAGLIAAGEIVAFPTETVYGLGADGLNAEAVGGQPGISHPSGVISGQKTISVRLSACTSSARFTSLSPVGSSIVLQ